MWSTRTSNLVTSKIIINSTVPTPGENIFTMDVKIYLNTRIDRFEKIIMKLYTSIEEISRSYKLHNFGVSGWVYIKYKKSCMDYLRQVCSSKHPQGILGCIRSLPLPVHDWFYQHVWSPTTFSFVIDYFGIKFDRNQ